LVCRSISVDPEIFIFQKNIRGIDGEIDTLGNMRSTADLEIVGQII